MSTEQNLSSEDPTCLGIRCSTETAIPNSLLQDPTLTWAARGLLCYMLSLPPDRKLNESHLVMMAPSSRDHLRGLVKELERNGYLRRTQIRGTGGRLSQSHWEVCNHRWETDSSEILQDGPSGGDQA